MNKLYPLSICLVCIVLVAWYLVATYGVKPSLPSVPDATTTMTSMVSWDASKIASDNVSVGIIEKLKDTPIEWSFTFLLSTSTPNNGEYRVSSTTWGYDELTHLTASQHIEIGCVDTKNECRAIDL